MATRLQLPLPVGEVARRQAEEPGGMVYLRPPLAPWGVCAVVATECCGLCCRPGAFQPSVWRGATPGSHLGR